MGGHIHDFVNTQYTGHTIFFNVMSHVARNCIYPIGSVGPEEKQELVLYVHVSHCTVPPILLYSMYHRHHDVSTTSNVNYTQCTEQSCHEHVCDNMFKLNTIKI